VPEGESESRLAADFVVVGGGSAGAAASARLVERGATVLLLEAGGQAENPAIHDPARSHELWDGAEDWGYRTVPQPGCGGRELHLPRGKVVGGSSCLNAMIWVRGAPIDYDAWAHGGAEGWRWADVEPVFRRIEDRVGPGGRRGDGGPMTVLSGFDPDPIHRAIGEAAAAVGVPFNSDYNDGELDGFSFTQLTIRDGRRLSSGEAYLTPLAGDPALTVLTGAAARRLLFEGGRCSGIEWVRKGRLERARAGSEVVLCGGAIGSPQLLLLSGIGPAEELAALGIEVRLDLPGVGRNLHDHLLAPAIFAAVREIAPCGIGLPQPQSHLFWRSRPGLPAPDTQPIHFNVPLYEPWMEGPENGFSLMAGMIRPLSRGSVRLASADPAAVPLIDLGALACEADLEALAASLELCREIGAAPPLREWGAREIYPGPEVDSPAALREYVRETAVTYHHQVGSCRMGRDEMAVVDPRLRVHGVEGLRVADASVMPAVTSGNTAAPATMIGERLAELAA
jgi:choline dehydrogenase